MQIKPKLKRPEAGFTLMEILICFAVIGLIMGGVLTAYTNSANFAEHAGYSLAAQSLAVQQLELARAALWDTQSTPPIDNATNLPSVTTNILDLPISGTNVVYATNTLIMSNFTVTASGGAALAPAYIKMIQVTTTWPWNGGVASNVIVAYRAPDQ